MTANRAHRIIATVLTFWLTVLALLVNAPVAAQSSAPVAPPAQETPAVPAAPEIATGYSARAAVRSAQFMAVTAHPLASEAARPLLAEGASAIDAAIAAQMMLNLVEPQSSGIGGGGFLLYLDARTGTVHAYDGRETAPAGARPHDLLREDDDPASPPVVPDARRSGRSIGTPGLLRMLEAAHAEHGMRAWASLFDPAITQARAGFTVSPRLAASIAASQADLAADPASARHFLKPDGTPRRAGETLTNPELASSLERIAREGSRAFYEGPIAQAIVETVGRRRQASGLRVTPGRLSLDDLAHYRALKREPICTPYRQFEVCGMPPPSSGGLAIAQTLGILEHFDLPALKPPVEPGTGVYGLHGQGAHLLAEALRLAFADRNRYVADPDFVPAPGGRWSALTEPDYLRTRAGLVRADASLGTAAPGAFAPQGGSDAGAHSRGTTHLTVVDRHGNVVSMTTSIESAFGSFRMVHGFLLNNQLTDFSAQPEDTRGPIANRVEAHKRPRSSMAPTLVFERQPDARRGALLLATGSPGGAAIIATVARALVAALDWRLDPQQGAAMINLATFNSPTTLVEANHAGASGALLDALAERGHRVMRAPLASGLATIARDRSTGEWVGGADPRREGLAVGALENSAPESR